MIFFFYSHKSIAVKASSGLFWRRDGLSFLLSHIFCILIRSHLQPSAALCNLTVSLSRRSAACKYAGLCHIHSPLFNNSSILLCILEHTSLHCTGSVPADDQTETEERKKLLLIFVPLTPLPIVASARDLCFPSTSNSYSVNLGQSYWAPHSSGHSSPPSTCMGSYLLSSVLAELLLSEPFPVIDEALLQCQQRQSQH